jgi:putative SOS response-associated peptidase YedK
MYQLGNIEVAAAPPPVGAARNVEPRYNIAPTSTIDVVLPTADGPALVPMRWGLIPSWWKKSAKDGPRASPTSRCFGRRSSATLHHSGIGLLQKEDEARRRAAVLRQRRR